MFVPNFPQKNLTHVHVTRGAPLQPGALAAAGPIHRRRAEVRAPRGPRPGRGPRESTERKNGPSGARGGALMGFSVCCCSVPPFFFGGGVGGGGGSCCFCLVLVRAVWIVRNSKKSEAWPYSIPTSCFLGGACVPRSEEGDL